MANLKLGFQRCRRGIKNLIRWLFWEKPRGLDFSMRQKTRNIVHAGNHGYALTTRDAFDRMLGRITVGSDDGFIDIGCGKGGCLYWASKYPFGRIAGIEIEDSLYETARKNFAGLHLENRIELYHEDAVSFDRYSEFNVFYLFNPFDAEIYRQVLDRIFRVVKNRRGGAAKRNLYLLCYGASEADYIRDSGLFELAEEFTDPVHGRAIHIWKAR